MSENPDDPRVIAREKFEEKVWSDLCEELGREPNEDEFSNALDVEPEPKERDPNEWKYEGREDEELPEIGAENV